MMTASARPSRSPAPSPPRQEWARYVGLGLSALAMLLALISVLNAAGTPAIVVLAGIGFITALLTAVLWFVTLIQGEHAEAWTGAQGVMYTDGSSGGRFGGGAAWNGGMPWAPPSPPTPPSSLYSSEQLQQAAQRTSEPAGDDANPLHNDPLYALDPVPASMRCFILPKEGETLARCQDSYALDVARYRFAVTDGVSNSFVPRPWARLVAQGFVAGAEHVASAEGFGAWMEQAAQAWRKWMWERWVPAINAQRERRGDRLEDWASQIEQKGAESTLIGCALYKDKHTGGLQARLWSVGDAECLIARPVKGAWGLLQAFPFTLPDQFDAFPLTLSTLDQPGRVAQTWEGMRQEIVEVVPGDCVVLTSDTLAKWALAQPDERMSRLLALDSVEAFAGLVQAERDSGAMEDDDMTMLVIPISAPSRKVRGQASQASQTQTGARR